MNAPKRLSNSPKTRLKWGSLWLQPRCGKIDRHIRCWRDKWRDGGGLIAFVPRRLGRPLKATAAVIGFLVLTLWDLRTQSRSRITYGQLKTELAARHQMNLGESTIRALITQEYGLEALLETLAPDPSPSANEGEVICRSGYGGAWLLVPILHRMRLLQRSDLCRAIGLERAPGHGLSGSGSAFVMIQLEPFPDQAALTSYLEWVNQQCLPLPWLNNLVLQIAISADQPTGPPMGEAQMRKGLFAG